MAFCRDLLLLMTKYRVFMKTMFDCNTMVNMKALNQIEYIFNKNNKPMYVGYVANEIGHSIERTMQMCQILYEKNVIRPLTLEEKKSKDIGKNHEVWMLTGMPSASKAHHF